MPDVREVDPEGPGWTRRGRGRGFEYLDDRGRRLSRRDVERIRRLAIPPAWKEVWICPDPSGHIQAHGRDEAGRRQYVYHPGYRDEQDRLKFEAMTRFARRLPRIRRKVRRDLAPERPDRTSVLAAAIRLLDLGSFRTGSEEYAEEHGTFGLATVLRDHARVEGQEVVFDYPAKHGQRRVLRIGDRKVAELIARLKRRRSGGEELLAYREGAAWQDLRSADINEWVATVAGPDFTAKAFRTWNANLIAAAAFAAAEPPEDGAARERAAAGTCRVVAEAIGNTPQVCRDSYLDPRLIDAWIEDDGLDLLRRAVSTGRPGTIASRERLERALVTLLERRAG